ncbi:hypothetical protein D3C71_2196700 [compost metagenome]
MASTKLFEGADHLVICKSGNPSDLSGRPRLDDEYAKKGMEAEPGVMKRFFKLCSKKQCKGATAR